MSILVDSPKVAIERSFYWMKFFCDKLNMEPMKVDIEFSNRMSRTAGMVWTMKKRPLIKYSNKLMAENPGTFDKTIAHELAHLYADKLLNRCQKHNNNWKKVMSLTGYEADRCHQYDVKVKRRSDTYVYKCDCGNEIGVGKKSMSNILAGRYISWKCGKCKIHVLEKIRKEISVFA